MSQRVELFFLGGTISMSGSTDGGVTPTLGADELLAAIPGLAAQDVELSGTTVAREQSGSLTFSHLLQVLAACRASAADGFVLVQGTDTLEESAYFLDLLWDDARPIVVTGAMRNPTMAGADGPANLLSAITAAAAPASRDRGVLVAFSDELHAARFVTKTDTSSIATFKSPTIGPLGRVLEGQVRYLTHHERHDALPTPQADAFTEVEVPILTVAISQSDATLRAIGRMAHALVIAGFGAGHVPGWWVETLEEIAAEKTVLMTSRTSSGPALTQTYGAIGAEVDLQKRGIVMAGHLDALKARLIVTIMLAGGASRAVIEAEIMRRGEYA